uniref:Uncharacterized protein n=1 Tax=Anguilla anguilla TaxID=7936 RepID=A0A0E9TQJ9_ANGAN
MQLKDTGMCLGEHAEGCCRVMNTNHLWKKPCGISGRK